jgi:thiol-disulfide isomerase/thioredoxin
MQWFNHYSVVIIGAVLLVATVVSKGRPRYIMACVVGVYAVTCAALWPKARIAPTTGLPVLLEIQSPFCLGCVAMKPAVDRLEEDLREKIVVRRVDVQSDAGRQLMKQYDIEFTPTFILFDAAGKERWRGTGKLDAEAVRRSVDEKS